ncbi:MBOAT family protein [Butyrivibrio sp. INlla16]|uniref:MBOAT family O-acyltransferase n=1 Tax=Butyrivibrio sp. INlla16 TaxID=1520807 RepID=UPI00089090B1|nr:MBOAT family O-acyltransferase [Butyrivibrio sp. INlla16]SDB34777.1 alginate O-acetyltransferase complex protein AlgI [Butyrivibrio sp. INlla16]
MVFSSLTFLFFFLPAFLILYYVIPGRAKNFVLLIFSLLFYAWGEPIYILLMLFSSFVDYTDGRLQERFASSLVKKRVCLVIALLINFSLLGYFKYADFSVGIWNALTPFDVKLPGVALPVGISFYTFQTVSYSIDVYKGRIKAEKNYLDYLTYVSMFPQLIAGPIVRFSTVQQEIHSREISESGFVSGMKRFILGLLRKVLIANQIGALWDTIRVADGISIVTAWLGLLCFTLQLYYDFSAYSDMAIGLGQMLGFHFPENFIYPLSSVSVTDFWRRWHVSLSTWFRDYVYIPLGGNRVGMVKHFRNIFVVWFLTGLWHGASWNFVLWGLYHGTLLTLEKFIWGKWLKKLPMALQHLYAIIIVIFGFGIFTFDNLSEMGTYFVKLIGIPGNPLFGTEFWWYTGNYLPVLLAAIVLSFPVYPAFVKKVEGAGTTAVNVVKTVGTVLMAGLFILAISSLVKDTYNPFLYFRF